MSTPAFLDEPDPSTAPPHRWTPRPDGARALTLRECSTAHSAHPALLESSDAAHPVNAHAQDERTARIAAHPGMSGRKATVVEPARPTW